MSLVILEDFEKSKWLLLVWMYMPNEMILRSVLNMAWAKNKIFAPSIFEYAKIESNAVDLISLSGRLAMVLTTFYFLLK